MRPMKKKIVLFAMAGIMGVTGVVGCSQKTADDKKSDNSNKESNEVDNKVLSEDEKLFESLFDINNRIQIKIDISDKEKAKIQKDFDEYQRKHSKSPIYRMADKVTIIIGDQTYEMEEVGVRLKGNTSRTDFYNENEGMYKLVHLRLSFDETFDNPDYYGTDVKVWTDEKAKEERKNRTFATLSSLEMKWNRNFDTTYIREYYANEMFRAFGVMSQHQNMSCVNFGGDNLGVYSIYEPVDKKFISKYYDGDDKKGDLYKAAWTYEPATYTKRVTYGIKNPETGNSYNYDLKTNKKTSDHSLFKNLIEVVNNGGVTEEEFDKVIDKDYWVKFAAVSYFVGNPDDMRNNFNNHYVYIKPDGQAVFVPYDNDRVFGITVGWNPDHTGMTEVSPYSEMAEGLGSFQFNPIYLKTVINENGFYFEEYNKMLEEVANSEWMTEEHFEKYFEIVKNNYQDLVEPDKDYNNASKKDFVISLESVSNDDHKNMSMLEYLTKKLETYHRAVDENE